MNNYKVGDVFEAKVKKIIASGAFVGISEKKDGYLHVSSLSNRRVDRVEDVLHVGQTLRVRIADIDEEKGRVRLELVDKNDLEFNRNS